MCGTAPFMSMTAAGEFNPEDFCTLYASICTDANQATGYANRQMCLTNYGMVTTQIHCRSYHLCNANVSASNATTHCPHSTGTGLCTGN